MLQFLFLKISYSHWGLNIPKGWALCWQ